MKHKISKYSNYYEDDDNNVNHSHIPKFLEILFFQMPHGLDCYFYKILVCLFLWQLPVLCSHLFKKIIHIVCVISSIEASWVEHLHAQQTIFTYST